MCLSGSLLELHILRFLCILMEESSMSRLAVCINLSRGVKSIFSQCFVHYELNRTGEFRVVSRKVCLLQFQMEERGIMTLVFSYTRWKNDLLEHSHLDIRSDRIR